MTTVTQNDTRTEPVPAPTLTIRLSDELAPQYGLVGYVEQFIEENRDWLRTEAQRRLAVFDAAPTYEMDGKTIPAAHPAVIAHLRTVAAS